MKCQKLALIILIGLFILQSLSVVNLINSNEVPGQSILLKHNKESIVLHDEPINITSNTDFMNMAKEENWSGNGSILNPYRIHNLTIESAVQDLITIQNVDMYVEVGGCTLRGTTGYTAVRLVNCSFITVWKNAINGSGIGIKAEYCSELSIFNNSILHTQNAISLVESSRSVINFNKISTANVGINSFTGITNAYSENYIEDCFYGLRLLNNSSKNMIRRNYFLPQ